MEFYPSRDDEEAFGGRPVRAEHLFLIMLPVEPPDYWTKNFPQDSDNSTQKSHGIGRTTDYSTKNAIVKWVALSIIGLRNPFKITDH